MTKLPANWNTLSKAEKVAHANKTLSKPDWDRGGAKLPTKWDTLSKAEKVAYANKVLNAPKPGEARSSATPASWGSASKESKVALAKMHFSSSPRYGSQWVPTPEPIPAKRRDPNKPSVLLPDWRQRGTVPPSGPPKRRYRPMPLPKPSGAPKKKVTEGRVVVLKKGAMNRRANP